MPFCLIYNHVTTYLVENRVVESMGIRLMNAFSTFRGFAVVFLSLCSIQQSAWATTLPTFLVNPGVYTATASSEFLDGNLFFPVVNLFDDSDTTWAIDGFAGNNSQGRDEGWVSINLDQAYLISDLRFAARKPTGSTDGIDEANIWVSKSPFSVDVTSATSTNAFLATLTGQVPDLTLGPFDSFADLDYSFGSVLPGKYVLAQFVNTSDGNNNRNLGVRTLEVGIVGVVPEPTTYALALVGLCLTTGRCCQKLSVKWE